MSTFVSHIHVYYLFILMTCYTPVFQIVKRVTRAASWKLIKITVCGRPWVSAQSLHLSFWGRRSLLDKESIPSLGQKWAKSYVKKIWYMHTNVWTHTTKTYFIYVKSAIKYNINTAMKYIIILYAANCNKNIEELSDTIGTQWIYFKSKQIHSDG